jgi:type IV pilus assembly protein PilO
MHVIGGYHDLAIFFDKVARLSRIVNIKNISMGPGKDTQNLNTTCTAVTYKFIEPAPKKPTAKKPAKKPKKKRKKR